MQLFIRGGVVFLCASLVGACETYATLTPVASADQDSVYQDGRQSLISKKGNVVIVAPESTPFKYDGRANFVVIVENGTAEQFLITSEDVSAKYEAPAAKDEDSSGPSDIASFFNISSAQAKPTEGQPVEEERTTLNPEKIIKPLKTYSYQELVSEEKTRQQTEAFFAALSGAMNTMAASNAGYTNHYGSYSGNYGTYGSNRYSGNYSGTSYNYGAAQAARNAAQAQTTLQLQAIESAGQQNLQQLAGSIFKSQTVRPGNSHGGVVVIDAPIPTEMPTPIILSVNINGENHDFSYVMTKVSQQ